jgi:hypothetical protein
LGRPLLQLLGVEGSPPIVRSSWPAGRSSGPIFALPSAAFPFTLSKVGFRRVANRRRPIFFHGVDLGHVQGYHSGPFVLL